MLYCPLVPTQCCHCKDFPVALGLAEPEIVKYEHEKKEHSSRFSSSTVCAKGHLYLPNN